MAAVCMNAAPGQIEKNLDRIQSFVSDAARRGANIVCFPELCVTGYIIKRPDDVYTHIDHDEVMNRLIHIAQKGRVLIIVGLIEISDGAKPYITQVVTGPNGLIGLYRKAHLSPAEKDVYQAGQQASIFSYKDTSFGVQLCYDAHFPEISTIMALKGADILFIPHASPRGAPKEKLKSWLRHLTARAFDNGIFLVACNQAGKTSEGFSFPGIALVLGPDGQILAKYEGEKENILFADLKAEALSEIRQHRMKYFLPHRRPDLYRKLVER